MAQTTVKDNFCQSHLSINFYRNIIYPIWLVLSIHIEKDLFYHLSHSVRFNEKIWLAQSEEMDSIIVFNDHFCLYLFVNFKRQHLYEHSGV